jgi:uncharacterized membrane protein YiaA
MFKRVMFFAVIMLVITASICYAGVFDTVKDWFSENAIAYILTGLLAIGVLWNIIAKINTTIKEIGQVMIIFADMTSDRKITTEEWLQFKKEIKDVFNIFAKTPDKFKVK